METIEKLEGTVDQSLENLNATDDLQEQVYAAQVTEILMRAEDNRKRTEAEIRQKDEELKIKRTSLLANIGQVIIGGFISSKLISKIAEVEKTGIWGSTKAVRVLDDVIRSVKNIRI